jgi:hypothetical protein
MASLAFVLLPDSLFFYPDVDKISIELLKALETLAQQYYTLPNGMALLKATYLLMP